MKEATIAGAPGSTQAVNPSEIETEMTFAQPTMMPSGIGIPPIGAGDDIDKMAKEYDKSCVMAAELDSAH